VLLAPGRFEVLKQSATAAVAYFPALLLSTGIAAAIWGVIKARNAEQARRERILGASSLFALAVYLEVYPRADYYHLIRVLPLVFMVLVLLLQRLAPVAKRLFGEAKPHLLAAVPVLFLLLVGLKDTWGPQFDGVTDFLARTPLNVERGRGLLVSERDAMVVSEVSRMIEEHSAIGDSIFSFSRRGGAFYFLSRRRNPTRLLWWDSSGIRDEDRQQVTEMLRLGAIPLVIVQDAFSDSGVNEILAANYDPVGSAGDLTVLARKTH
jgi:hypothetical protein